MHLGGLLGLSMQAEVKRSAHQGVVEVSSPKVEEAASCNHHDVLGVLGDYGP